MFQLRVAAGAIYLVLGDLGEALMLLAFVVIAVTITIVQEQRSEKMLQALLKKLALEMSVAGHRAVVSP